MACEVNIVYKVLSIVFLKIEENMHLFHITISEKTSRLLLQ